VSLWYPSAGLNLALVLAGGVVYAPASTTVHGHAVVVQTVLRNLLSNAIKFTQPGGQATVTVRQHAAETELRVRDTGTGIPADEVDALFDPSRRHAHEGTRG